jgi:hypothetical protein
MRLVGVAFLTLWLSLLLMPAATPAAKIECIAGCGGSLDGTAKAARLIEPFGVAFDKLGIWYICEYKGQRFALVDAHVIITYFAGG